MKVSVLRIGQRPVRDYRVTTHLALVARAFGADDMLVVNAEDEIGEAIAEINLRWGGNFEVREVSDWRSTIEKWKESGGKVAHLTMYGINIDNIVEEIRKENSDLLIVVGAEKVPREVYDLSDYNVAVGNQPHSEIAALALLLDRLFQGSELQKQFHGKMRIIPSRRGKIVELREVS